MLNAHLAEIEHSFRRQWRSYQPQNYATYLSQVEETERPQLLARLLSVELEYAYQPPQLLGESAAAADAEEDDERARPRLRLFLLRFPELAKHRDIIVQLAMLEFALRLRFDSEPPSYESYLDLCPDEKERLADMLQVVESKLYKNVAVATHAAPALCHDTTVPEGKAERPLSLAQLPCNLGYFLLVNVIGQGGMGTVYSAIDLRSAAHVAVKLVRRFDSWSVYRFIEEFTWLANLNHPNVVKLYDTFSEGELRYFSMELVEGKALRDWFYEIRAREDAWQRLRRVLSQAALAVSFLHDHGVVHRDIKSSNLMVTGRDKAVLLDLGLTSRVHQDRATTRRIDGEHLIGTLPYLSPEALAGAAPSFPSDWYSFGVMMYEAITGEFPPGKASTAASATSPQAGSTAEAPLDAAPDVAPSSAPHSNPNSAPGPSADAISTAVESTVSAVATPSADERRGITLRAQLAHCPEDLRELCVQLLELDPQHRPTAASIISQLGSDLGSPIALRIAESDFVGREEAFEFLERGLHSIEQGRSEVLLIRGESGLGKTTLLQHWRRKYAERSDMLWLMVRCRNQDHTPLRALNQLVQELVVELSKQPSEAWIDLAQSGGEEVVYTFPQMERLSDAVWPTPKAASDPVEASARRAVGLHALMVWLQGLSQRKKLILVIDDAQWADPESGRILSQLIQNREEFYGLIVVVDQGLKTEGIFLKSLLESEPGRMRLPASHDLSHLSLDDCLSLLKSWAARVRVQPSDRTLEDISVRSGGSPFLLQELFRAYVNYVVRHKLADDSWLEDSGNGEGVLYRRFSMLPPTTEKVLQFLAVADQALGIHQLQTATRILPAQLVAELNYLSGQGWIRWTGANPDSEIEISHERFRDVVLQSMLDDRLQRRHYRLARMLSAEVPPPWPRIGHHYAMARQFREAAACYMEGARAAARHLSFPEALWLLDLAFHPQAQRTSQEVRDAKRLRADCLAGNGSSSAAAEQYNELALSSTDPQAALELQCLAGEQWIRAGQLERGMTALKPALMSLQIDPDDRSAWTRYTTRLKALYHSLAAPPSLELPDSTQPFSPIEQTLNRVCSPLAFLDNELGARLILRIIKLVRHRGSPQDRAIAMMRWAVVLSYSKRRLRQRALRWMRAARGIQRRSPSANFRALEQVSMFIWLNLQGRFYDSSRFGKRAERLFQASGASDTWESGFVAWIGIGNLWQLGEIREMSKRTMKYRQDAERRIDTIWTFWMHVHFAHLADLIRDDPAEGRRSLDKAAQVIGDGQLHTPQIILWMSRVRQALYENQPHEAVELFEALWPQVKTKPMLRIAYYAWIVQSLRANCHLAAWIADPSAPSHLHTAKDAVATILRLEDPVFLIYGEALRLVIESLEGKNPEASRWTSVMARAEEKHLGLLTRALQWHYAIRSQSQYQSNLLGQSNLPGQSQSQTQTHSPEYTAATAEILAARQAFINEGVVQPQRLMNLILPLPQHAEV